MILMWTLQS